MSIFGSREDDPLLQDDPFAPSSDDASDEPSSRNESPDESEAGAEAARGNATTQEGQSSSSTTTADDSPVGGVFDFASGTRGRSADGDPSREIVRSLEQAASGQLGPVKDALDEGWRLRRVELQEAAAPDQPQPAATRSLTFVLHRPGA